MSYAFDSRLGKRLYQLLPEVYRTRDKSGDDGGPDDLARYLDVHGHLLDLIHATLEQQLDDTLPESSQDWLLPYFAELLAANLVSPDATGRHSEVKNAVSWRQRKGTLRSVEEIAEAVGQREVEVQEGWQRVALTPRVGMPLIPSKAWDSTLDIDMEIPSEAIRHPSLPAAMVDFRRASRAVEAQPGNPAARESNFGGVFQVWRQRNRHGVPCFPGSFDDVSRRTVDFRTPGEQQGHHHHKRLLLYVAPPSGSFPFEPIRLAWAERNDWLHEHLFDEVHENGVTVIRNRSDRVIEITNNVELPAGAYVIEGIHFAGELKLEDSGSLELRGVEADRVDVPGDSNQEAVLVANNCLFRELSSGGPIRLTDTTVVGPAFLTSLIARDCVLMDLQGTDISGVIEFSRIPDTATVSDQDMTIEDCTTEEPVFFAHQTALTARAVLAPSTPRAVYSRASDGGEPGYFHRGRYGDPVRIVGDFTGPDALQLLSEQGYPLVDVFFEGEVEVTRGQLQLLRTSVSRLDVQSALPASGDATVVPALSATDCLFGELSVDRGLARLEYCTVMQSANCKYLQASDCILAGPITGARKPAASAPSFLNCIRFSSIPAALMEDIVSRLRTDPIRRVAEALRLIDQSDKIMLGSNTLATPVFIELDYCSGGVHERRTAEFGEPGYGVLHPVTSDEIRFGAEDGGEMGAWHYLRYSLKDGAVLEKVKEFLPVGIEPVLIQDTRLLAVPPELRDSEAPVGNGE